MQLDVHAVLAELQAEVDLVCGQLAEKRRKLELQALASQPKPAPTIPIAPITPPRRPAEPLPGGPATPIVTPTGPQPDGPATPTGRPVGPDIPTTYGGGSGPVGTPPPQGWVPSYPNPEPAPLTGGTDEGTGAETRRPSLGDPIDVQPEPELPPVEIETPDEAKRVAQELVGARAVLAWIRKLLRF